MELRFTLDMFAEVVSAVKEYSRVRWAVWRVTREGEDEDTRMLRVGRDLGERWYR